MDVFILYLLDLSGDAVFRPLVTDFLLAVYSQTKPDRLLRSALVASAGALTEA